MATKSARKSDNKNCKVIRQIALIRGESYKRAPVELNEVSWHKGEPIYDLRQWIGDTPAAGFTLNRTELETLMRRAGEELGYVFDDEEESEEENNEFEEELEEEEQPEEDEAEVINEISANDLFLILFHLANSNDYTLDYSDITRYLSNSEIKSVLLRLIDSGVRLNGVPDELTEEDESNDEISVQDNSEDEDEESNDENDTDEELEYSFANDDFEDVFLYEDGGLRIEFGGFEVVEDEVLARIWVINSSKKRFNLSIKDLFVDSEKVSDYVDLDVSMPDTSWECMYFLVEGVDTSIYYNIEFNVEIKDEKNEIVAITDTVQCHIDFDKEVIKVEVLEKNPEEDIEEYEESEQQSCLEDAEEVDEEYDEEELEEENAEEQVELEEEINPESLFVHGGSIGLNSFKEKGSQEVIATLYCLDEKLKISTIELKATYCPEQGEFYIFESGFERAAKQGRLLCRQISELKYSDLCEEISRYGEAKDGTILDLLGYNVESELNVSAKYRQALLSEYINRKVISKEWAETAISNLIKYNRGRVTKWGAIRKWREDLEFLQKVFDSSAFKGKRVLGTQRKSE